MDVDVSELIEQVEDEARRLRDDAATVVLESAKEAAPVGADVPGRARPPGGLRDSLEIVDVGEDGTVFAMSIQSEVPYAGFTDEIDTAAHEIAAVNAPVLRFWWENAPDGARFVSFRRVWHPGTSGQRWFESQNQDRWDDALQEVL